jgi:hypothetical protein
MDLWVLLAPWLQSHRRNQRVLVAAYRELQAPNRPTATFDAKCRCHVMVSQLRRETMDLWVLLAPWLAQSVRPPCLVACFPPQCWVQLRS